MKQNSLIRFFLILFLLLCFSGCGMVDDEPEDTGLTRAKGFQLNNDQGFVLTDIFNGEGALEEAWNSFDGMEASQRLSDTVNADVDAFQRFSDINGNILKGENNPVSVILNQNIRDIVGDILDPSTDYRIKQNEIGSVHEITGEAYNEDFFTLLDEIHDDNYNSGDKRVVEALGRILKRIKDKKSKEEIKTDMNDLIEDILDPDFTDDYKDVSKLIGKLFIQCDYPVWLKDSGNILTNNVVTNPENINTDEDINLETGNAVQGVEELSKWFRDVMHDDEARALLKNCLKEVATVFDPDENSQNAEKLKEILINIEENFTESGKNFSKYNTSNIDAPLDTSKGSVYKSSEIKNAIIEELTRTGQLLVRSDRPNAITGQIDNKEPEYYLKKFITNLSSVGYDPDTLSIENSFNDLMQHDLYGRDRTNPEENAFSSSFLESMLFLTFLSGNNGWEDGGNTGEIEGNSLLTPKPRALHGHGKHVGYVTVGDSLFSIKTNPVPIDIVSQIDTFISLYDLTLHDGSDEHISRSISPFTTDNKDNYRYDYDINYPALQTFTGPCAGDAGTPTGGNPDGVSPGRNQFSAYSPTGLKEQELAAWTMGWAIRACYQGEGPYYYNDPDAETVTIGDTVFYKYLRPSGKVYAYANSDKTIYYYPVDEGDAADNDDTLPTFTIDGVQYKQRFNRFKSEWYSDYYMVNRVKYCLLGATPCIGSPQNYYTITNTNGDPELVQLEEGDSAGRLKFSESVSETDPKRACSSKEEAFFRNFQWVETEKKMVMVIPMYINMLNTIGGSGVAFQVLEANGYAGLGNMRKFGGNHVWAKKCSKGDSHIPGDFRVSVLANIAGAAGLVSNEEMVYNKMLGNGNAVPSVVGHNLAALYRMAFPVSPYIRRNDSVSDNIVGSQDFNVGDEIWNKRNAAAMIFVSLASAIRENMPDYDPDTPYLHSGLKVQTEALYPFINTLFSYQNDSGTYPHKTWKPLVKGEDMGNYTGDPYNMSADDYYTATGDTLQWFGSWGEREFYQPAANKTPLNILYDSDLTNVETRMDGIFPLITKTHALTDLLKLLMSDVNNTDKLYSAIEQLTTSLKMTKSRAIEINEQTYKNYVFPDYLFAEADNSSVNQYGMIEKWNKTRDCDIILDKGLDRIIGRKYIDEENDGYGLVDYIEEQNNESWEGFNDSMDFIEDILYPESEYSILNSILDYSDDIFNRETNYTDEQIESAVYIIGKLFAKYKDDKTGWSYEGDEGFTKIYDLITKRLPELHELIKDETGDNYYSTLAVLSDMMGKDKLAEYLVETVSVESGWEQILNDLYGFLGKDIIVNHDPLWSTVSTLMDDMAEAIKVSNEDGYKKNVYKKYGFQINW